MLTFFFFISGPLNFGAGLITCWKRELASFSFPGSTCGSFGFVGVYVGWLADLSEEEP